MFYSPFDKCEVCKQYVLLDQTQPQCAREHDCHVEKCPLDRFFAEPVIYEEPGPGGDNERA